MRIDTRTHSIRSDGPDEPAALIDKAASSGLDVVALTDHDTTAGWAEAGAGADRERPVSGLASAAGRSDATVALKRLRDQGDRG